LARDLQAHEIRFFDRLKPPAEIGEPYITRIREDASKHNGRLLVACQGKKVVGYVSLLLVVTNEDDPEERPYSYSSIGDLSVAKDFRGQGIGNILMEECERLAKASGQKWLRLSVLANNTGAYRFYKSFGMEDLLIRLEKKL
jgi:ribosomal protein S18 acetylase RimI-like enzyme